MRVLLELIRILILLLLLGTAGSILLTLVYQTSQEPLPFTWLGTIALLILIFVLYRNRLQFTGWYRGEGRVKLPKSVALLLIFVALLLMVSPFVLFYFVRS